jgi:putative transposase
MHRRQSIRLKGYDYSRPGAYFITICVNERRNLLGQLLQGRTHLSEAGIMVRDAWHQLPDYYSGFDLDEFVVMPNHIHGIILIKSVVSSQNGKARGPAPTPDGFSLPDVVHRFKTLTTKRYADSVKILDWPVFYKRFWQRNYHEHIIRDDIGLATIRHYIQLNPENWEMDTENRNSIPIAQKRKYWKSFLNS